MVSRSKTSRATRQNSASLAVSMPWNLSTLRPILPVKPGVAQVGEHRCEVRLVAMPDAVGHQLVEAEAELGGPAREGDQELGVEERLAAGEAEQLDAGGVGLFEEADGGRDVEPVGPLDRHAAVRAGQVALVRAGERKVVRPETCGCALHGAGDRPASTVVSNSVRPSLDTHEDHYPDNVSDLKEPDLAGAWPILVRSGRGVTLALLAHLRSREIPGVRPSTPLAHLGVLGVGSWASHSFRTPNVSSHRVTRRTFILTVAT